MQAAVDMPKKKKTKTAPKRKPGRPPTEIDWEQFDKLCQIHATIEEIAGWFRCEKSSIERACKAKHGKGFGKVWIEKSAGGKVSLRRSMWQKALKGDNTMMIWLSKQHLGFSDHAKYETKIKSDNRVVYFPDNGRG